MNKIRLANVNLWKLKLANECVTCPAKWLGENIYCDFLLIYFTFRNWNVVSQELCCCCCCCCLRESCGSVDDDDGVRLVGNTKKSTIISISELARNRQLMRLEFREKKKSVMMTHRALRYCQGSAYLLTVLRSALLDVYPFKNRNDEVTRNAALPC